MSTLKIIDVNIYKFDIPLRDIFQIATMSVETAQNVLIQIVTDQGIAGWGEAAPFHALVGETQLIDLAVAKEIKNLIIRENALEINALIKKIDRFLPHNPTIKSAFDMALYDISSKAANMPLYLFLGGSKREIETNMTIGICEPSLAGDKALAIKDMGFKIIKVKLGNDTYKDHQRLGHIRSVVGDSVSIRIDANQGWDRVTAVENLRSYEDMNIEFCEQPCMASDSYGLKYISENCNIPVMADESIFSPANALNLINNNSVPYFNVKFSKSGGIFNASKIANIAETGFVSCMVGCMSETRLGLTAAAHFGLSSDIFKFFDLDSHLEHVDDPIIGGMTIEDGMISVPDEIGIGAYPDPEYIKTLEEVR